MGRSIRFYEVCKRLVMKRTAPGDASSATQSTTITSLPNAIAILNFKNRGVSNVGMKWDAAD